MKATIANVINLGKQCPLSDAESNLIRQSFRPQYVETMLVYALTYRKRRAQLQQLLRGEEYTKYVMTSRSPRQVTQRSMDFVLRSGNTTINMNDIFSPRQTSKILSPRHYDSDIKTQKIFGEPAPPPPPDPPANSSLTTFRSKRIFNVNTFERIKDVVDSHSFLIEEIFKYCERSSNSYPTDDPDSCLPKLNTRREALLVSQTLKEDHIGHPTIVKSTNPIVTPTQKFEALSPRSNYSESFSPDIYKNIPKLQLPYRPPPGTRPFVLYPEVKAPPEEISQEKAAEQVAMNRSARRAYYEFANAKTVL